MRFSKPRRDAKSRLTLVRKPPDRGTPTPKLGNIFTATVRGLASDGRGVLTHPSGLTIFAAGVWLGETGEFRFLEIQKQVGVAALVNLVEAHSGRMTPPCPHQGYAAGQCGGCPWQFIDYTEQLTAKQERIATAVARVSNCTVQPIWPSPLQWGYRNRAQFKTDGEQVGYSSAASHQLAAIDDCIILTEPNRNRLQQLRAQLPNPAWRPRTRQTLTELHIDETTTAENLAVNQRLPFRQSNSQQNTAMQQWLETHCATLANSFRVLELFCGSGNFTAVLAKHFATVVAVDSGDAAIASLRDKALPNVDARCENLYADGVFDTLHERGPFDVLVLDPPREGLKQTQNLTSKKRRFKAIFYISCDLATFCRDAQWLMEQGYRLQEVQPLDQAPHTPHVEILARFSLR